MDKRLLGFLKKKSLDVREETLRLHCAVPESRIASALSDIEIFIVLYYGRILNFKAKNPEWEKRDRLIVSKGHGGISLYPILADLDFFDRSELKNIGKNNSLLKAIPDCLIPGFETINGALGNGLGVACGMAIALKRRNSTARVFVLCGDGELNEGAVWEAVMFASQHKLDNLILIVDNNKLSMLGYCKDIINLEPLDVKFEAFNWKVKIVDGHDIEHLYRVLKEMKTDKARRPRVLIANTIKGKGVLRLEKDPLCHIRSLKKEEVDSIIKDLRCQKKR